MGRVFLGSLLAAIAVATWFPASGAAAFGWLGQYGVGSATGASGGVYPGGGIGVAPDGTVVVSDVSAIRVAILSPSGRFLRAVGKDVSVAGGAGAEVCADDCQYGSAGGGAGELDVPWGIVARAGEFYVAESNNGRVSVFDYGGRFLRAFGADVGGPGVNVCTVSCVAGTQGAAGGQMAGPAGLALGLSGELYVSQLGTNRVDAFDPRSGQFLRAFGKDVGGPGVDVCTTSCGVGTNDGTPGAIGIPFGLATSPGGEVFVGELGPSRVSVFDGQGTFLRTFGAPGQGAGELSSPNGVAASADGQVYVADSGNNRIAVFGSGGDFRRAFGLDVIPGSPSIPEVCTSLCQAGTSGVGIGEFSGPRAVAVDSGGDLYTGTFGRVDRWGELSPSGPPVPSGDVAATTGGSSTAELRPPSNALRFGKRRLDRRTGTARIEVTVAGPGRVVVNAGPKVRARATQPRAAGTVSVRLGPKAVGRRVLRRSGRLWCALRVTFTPRNGSPFTRTKAVRLLLAPPPR